jgi:hypothetical protein
VREIAQDFKTDLRFQSSAVLALQVRLQPPPRSTSGIFGSLNMKPPWQAAVQNSCQPRKRVQKYCKLTGIVCLLRFIKSGILSSSAMHCDTPPWSADVLQLAYLSQNINLVLCRRLPRPTWWVFLKTPTWLPFTLRGSPSCPRTSSWLVASAGRGLKYTA